LDRIGPKTGEQVEGIKTGETAESLVFMRLFGHVDPELAIAPNTQSDAQHADLTSSLAWSIISG
jgi:hypothetical protein